MSYLSRHFEFGSRRYTSPFHLSVAGNKVRKKDNLDFATRLLEAGLKHYEHHPENHFIKHALAICYRVSGRSEAAIPLLQDVLHQVPNNAFAGLELAKIYTSKGEYNLARDHARHLLVLNPYNEHAMMALIQIEIETGRTYNAEALFERMSALGRRTPEFRKMVEVAENLIRPEALLEQADDQAFQEVIHLPNPVFKIKQGLTADFKKKRMSPEGLRQQETGSFEMPEFPPPAHQ